MTTCVCTELADRADTATYSEWFGALDLRIDTKPDLTPPVTDADEAPNGAARDARPAATRRQCVREEFGVLAPTGLTLGDRPDRRHQELRPRRAGVVHPDALLEDGKAHGRRGQRTRVEPTVVGRPGRGAHVVRRHPRQIAVSGVREIERREPVPYSDLTTGWDDRRERFVALTDEVWTGPRVWRLLVPLPGCRGGVDIAASPRSNSGTSRRWTSLIRRPAAPSLVSTGNPARTTAVRWPPTGLLHDQVTRLLMMKLLTKCSYPPE